MKKLYLRLFALLCLSLSLTAGWSKTVEDEAKELPTPAPVTETPDPATPFLVGVGLVVVSLVRRRLQNGNPED